MKYDGSLFFLAQSNLSDAFDVLSTLKTNISACTSSYPRGYEYKSDIEETKTMIFNVSSTVSSLTRTVSELKEKLMNLDNVFALNYYNDASQKYQDLVGPLTEEHQIYKEYTQKQFNEQLYKYLDDIKDNLTPEQKEIYDALKEQKVIEKKYNELQKLYEKKDDNNAFWHPVKEENLRQEILALENELREKHNVNINGYRNKWYEDFKDAGIKTGAAWVDAGKSLLKGEGLGKTLDAVKQTATTGAVVFKSAKSGVDKIDELVGDGLLAAGGSIVAGATWLFHDTWSDNDVAGTVMDWTLDQVRRDRVGEANKEFYEKNPIGKWINENSNLKYDSAGAKAIQSAGEFVGKVALATAATVVSGGAAAPIVIGALYGAGNAGEKYTQSVDRDNGESYTYGKALLRTTAGAVAGAAEFYGYGQMGAGMLGVNISPQASTSFVKNFLVKDTILDSASVIVDHGVNVAFGDETWQQALLYGGAEFAFALGMNAIGARQATKAARATQSMDDVVDAALRTDMDVDDMNYHFSTMSDAEKKLARQADIEAVWGAESDVVDITNTGALYYRKQSTDAFLKDKWIADNVDIASFKTKVAKADNMAMYYENNGVMTREKFYEVWGAPKGTKPDPSTYLPKEYVDDIMTKAKTKGISRFTSKGAKDYHIANGKIGYIADNSEFMTDYQSANKLIASVNNRDELAQALNVKPYEGEIYRYDILPSEIESVNVRIPSGNEEGAYLLDWIPGSHTLDGSFEVVIDSVDINLVNITDTGL